MDSINEKEFLKQSVTLKTETGTELVVTNEDIDDIMVGALEGGINYWCWRVAVNGDYAGRYASEQIARDGELELLDSGDGDGDKIWHVLNKEKLLKGIKLYAENYPNSSCFVLTDGKIHIDCCNADANICDSIVQYALFEDVVYG